MDTYRVSCIHLGLAHGDDVWWVRVTHGVLCILQEESGSQPQPSQPAPSQPAASEPAVTQPAQAAAPAPAPTPAPAPAAAAAAAAAPAAEPPAKEETKEQPVIQVLDGGGIMCSVPVCILRIDAHASKGFPVDGICSCPTVIEVSQT